MKSTLIIGTVVVCLALSGLIGVAVSLQAQEDTTEDNGCRWHVQTLHHATGGNHVTEAINALMWNDCSGELYHNNRSPSTSDSAAAIEITL